MSVIIQKDVTILFSSDPLVGAQNVSDDLSSFSVTLNSPLSIPNAAVDCSMAVIGATIWNDAANISPFYNNNQIRIVRGATILTIAFDEGLYSLENLQSTLAAKLVNQGQPRDLVLLTADNATSRVVLTLRYAGLSVDFRVANSIAPVLGFLTTDLITATVDNESVFGTNPAAFNRVNSFLITSDIVNNGVPINNNGRGIIAAIPINAPPGNECSYDPQNPIWVDASGLIGMSKQNFSFQLRDQSLRTVSTNEIFTFTIRIRYSIVLSNERMPLKP